MIKVYILGKLKFTFAPVLIIDLVLGKKCFCLFI